jgi:hypothetical protein
MALAAAAASLAVITTTGGGSAGAAVVSQTVNCGIGGSQTITLDATAPASVTQGEAFTVVLAPTGSGTASGAEIKNIVTNFTIPAGATYVAGSAALSGGSSNLGNKSVTVSGGNIAVSTPGPIANGASFTAPTLTFQLRATGTVGTVLRMRIKASGGYTLTAAGSFNVSCDASPQTNLTSTSIAAAPTTTTSSTTTTSTPGGSSTTTTAPAPTTTAPPIVTTQTWSPGTACGVEETVTAPANTTSVAITAVGGRGGQSGSQASSGKASGGTGGQAFGTFAAAGGQVFSGVVGCNGANGQNGGATTASAGGWANGGTTGAGSIVLFQTGAGGGGGGGASGVCLGADCVDGGSGTPLIVAGGGGGGGVSNCAGTPSGAGGSGGSGSTATGDGGFGPSGAKGGNGGNSGGSSGSILGGNGGVNTNQAVGAGGSSPSTGTFDGAGVSVVGGGGGGGFAGGAQGQNANTGCKGAGGGGGGSSWARNDATNAAFSTSSTPSVQLTFTISTPAPTTTTTTTAPTTTTTTAPTTTAPCGADVVPFATAAALVDQQFLDAAGRAPSASERTQWVTAITTCQATAEDLTLSLLSTDQTLDEARLVRLYLAFFNRPPDPTGFAFWQRQLDAGKGLINAARRFADSSEFNRTYGSLSNSAFIDLVYANVLDREPDTTGKAFWLTRLNNGTKNRGDVMINFSESSENRNKRANAVQVFRIHRTMLQRFPSSTAFFALLDPITAGDSTLAGAAKTIRTGAAYAARF